MAARRRFALRGRIALALSVIVAVAMVLSATICFVAMRSSLRGEVDSVLREQATAMTRFQPAQAHIDVAQLQAGLDQLAKGSATDGTSVFQVIGGDGHTVLKPAGQATMPLTSEDRATAVRPRGSTTLADRTVNGQHVRVVTIALANPSFKALQIGRSLTTVDHDLHDLAWTLALVGLIGTVLAAGAAWLLARPVAAPTEQALAGSLAAQHQLVADASHELRTPITSLRTNAELLTHHATLDPATRDQIAHEMVQQTEGLANLVTDLLDLAKDPETLALTSVRLDEVVLAVVADVQRQHPEVAITERVSPSLVKGSRPELERALRNLLENAVVHGDPSDGSPARVHVELTTSGVVTIRDWGTGLKRSEIPHLFDRFARGEDSRGRPGSGLGLAIVRQTIEAHDGNVTLRNAPDGAGAVAEIRLSPLGSVAHSSGPSD